MSNIRQARLRRFVARTELLILLLAASCITLAQDVSFPPSEQIAGQWDGLFQCDGYLNRFELKLTQQDPRTLSGTMQRSIVGPTFKPHTQPYQTSLPVAAQYDARTGTIALGAGQGRGRGQEIRIQGIVSGSGDRMTGSVNWTLGRGCSVVVMGKRFASAVSAIVKQSEPKLYRPKVDPRASCDNNIIEWMSQPLAYDQYSIQLRAAGGYAAHALFADERFEPFFGKPFAKLSKRDLTKLENQLARPCWGAIQSVGGPAQTAATVLNVVRQRPGARVDVMLYPHASEIARSWQQHALQATDPTDAQAAQQMTNAARLFTQVLWPEGAFNFSAQLAEKKATDGTQRLAAALDKLLSDSTPSLQHLESVAAFEQRYVVGTAGAMESPNRLTRRSRQEQLQAQQAAAAAFNEARAEFVVTAEAASSARQRAADYINTHIVRAATEYAALQTELNEVRLNLVPLERRTNSALARYVSPQSARAVRDIFDAQRDRQVAKFAAAETQRYAQAFGSVSNDLSGLKQLNRHYAALEQNYGPLLALPAFSELRATSANDRQRRLNAEQDTLIASVRQLDTVAGIESLVEQTVLSVDRNSPAFRPVTAAIEDKRAELAPFTGYPGAAFLNAVYARDTKTIDRIDSEYQAAFQRAFDQLGSDDLLTQAMRWTFTQIKLVKPMTATYLLNYQRHYRQCLRDDAARFTVTRTVPTTVTRNLLGWEIARSEGYTTSDDFLINKEFEIIFRHVGTMQPTNFLASLVDQAVGNGGITSITQGVRKMMNEHACDSEVIERMEEGIKAVFFR